MEQKRTINHLGQTLNTTFFKDISESEYQNILDLMSEKTKY